MRFSTTTATSALAATALAAPGPQWGNRPGHYGRPASAVSGDESCAAATATSTAFLTITEKEEFTKHATYTSTAVVVDPTGGSWTSTTTVVGPTGYSASATSEVGAEPTAPSYDDAASTCADATATLIKTQAPVTVTVTEGAPYPTGNDSAPAMPTSTGAPKKCITPQESEELAEVFRLLIQEYSDELALAALTEDFVDYSSAVNILMNKGAEYPKNISGPTFSGRQAFMDGQGSQPEIPFERLFTVYGCDSVSVRWTSSRSGAGQPTEAAMIPVFGNGIMKVVPSEEPVMSFQGVTYNWRVQTLLSEFNTAAWLVNLGVFQPEGKVDYINATNATEVKRSVQDFNFDFRGAMI